MSYISNNNFISSSAVTTELGREGRVLESRSTSQSAPETPDSSTTQNTIETNEYLNHHLSTNMCSFPDSCNNFELAYSSQLITAQDNDVQPLSQEVINAREKVRDLLLKFEPILRKDHFQFALSGIEKIESQEEAQRMFGRIVDMAQSQIKANESTEKFLIYADAIAETIIEIGLPPNPQEDPFGFAISLAAYAVPVGKLLQKIPGLESRLAKVLNISKDFLQESINRAAKVPQGLSPSKYREMSSLIRQDLARINQKYGLNLDMSQVQIATHGSRASRTASISSDIDIAIRVSPEEFDRAIKQLFRNPNPGSARERTMLHAINTGKIQRGEIGMRALGRRLKKELLDGMSVDISIIRQGGSFDRGPYLPLK